MAEINDSYILTDHSEDQSYEDRRSFLLQRLEETRVSSTSIEESPRGVGVFPNHRELMSSHFRLGALLETISATQATGRTLRNWRTSPAMGEEPEVFSLPASRESLARAETVWSSMADSCTVSSQYEEHLNSRAPPVSRTSKVMAIKKERPCHIKRRRFFLESGKEDRREGQ
jgi:hypothetical protein